MNTPDYERINFGYLITPNDVVSIKIKTLKYAWSLGIPYGGNILSPAYKYSGHIREYGIALWYQRFLWKGD